MRNNAKNSAKIKKLNYFLKKEGFLISSVVFLQKEVFYYPKLIKGIILFHGGNLNKKSSKKMRRVNHLKGWDAKLWV